MLSKQENFDRDVKRVLQEVHGEEIPLDFLVDIEQRLDQLEKKRKRRVFMWFFMGIVLASGLTFGLLRGSASSNTVVKTKPQKGTNIAQKTKVSKQIASSKSIRSIQTNAVQTTSVEVAGGTRTRLASVAHVKRTATRLAHRNQSNLIQTSNPRAVIKSSKAHLGTAEMTQDHQGMISVQKNDVPLAIVSVKSEPISNAESLNQITVPAATIPEIAPLINDFQVNTNSTSSNPVFPEPGILPIEKEKWVQTFGFFMGMSGIGSSVEVKENNGYNSFVVPDLKKYTEIRNAQERSTSSIDLSLRTSWMKHHFLIQTGVDYFEWGEQLKYDYNIVYDGVNRYSYVSVPLYLGYRQSWKSLELSASIGSSIGGVIKRDGYYLQENLTTIAVEQASNWTTTGYLQLELSYMKDNYRFSIAPTYRRSLTSVIFSGYTRNNYQSIGLQMGIAVILK
jgi:hypothetical protein